MAGDQLFTGAVDEERQATAVMVHIENPASLLERHFTDLGDRPAENPLLICCAVGFGRYQGDWLGVMITPWFMDLFLLPGGGSLWGDIPAGQRRYVDLPQGTVPFVAADDPKIASYQYSRLVAPVSTLPDMAAALSMAQGVMRGITGEPSLPTSVSPMAEERPVTVAAPEVNSRRGFFRRLAGKR